MVYKSINAMLAIAFIGTCFAAQNQVSIPSSCYKPAGKTCDWYADCIQQRYPCPNNNYAVQYAQYFCKKFGDDYHKFSSVGQQWVDGTRKCLQRVLVPYLDQQLSCADLKKKAFDSHTCCYLAGADCTPVGESAVSICDVPFLQWFKVFWTIKDAFNVFGNNSEVQGSIKGAMEVLKGCTFGKLGDEIENDETISITRKSLQRSLIRMQRGVIQDDEEEMEALNKLAEKLGVK